MSEEAQPSNLRSKAVAGSGVSVGGPTARLGSVGAALQQTADRSCEHVATAGGGQAAVAGAHPPLTPVGGGDPDPEADRRPIPPREFSTIDLVITPGAFQQQFSLGAVRCDDQNLRGSSCW